MESPGSVCGVGVFGLLFSVSPCLCVSVVRILLQLFKSRGGDRPEGVGVSRGRLPDNRITRKRRMVSRIFRCRLVEQSIIR